MLELTRQSTRQWRLEMAAVSLGFAGVLVVVLGLGPAPETLRGFAAPMGAKITSHAGGANPVTVLVADLYQYGWMLGAGSYLAYRTGTSTAREIDNGRLELLLTAPISRSQIIRARLFGLALTSVGMNLLVGGVFAVVWFGSARPLDPAVIVQLHAVAVPYFLVCGAIGLFVATVVRTARITGLVSGLLVAGLFGVEKTSPDGTLAVISTLQYYDPAAIVANGPVSLGQVAVLFLAAIVVSGLGSIRFRRRDLS